jgi:hypothetical protein
MANFQIKLGNEWKDFSSDDDKQLKNSYLSGTPSVVIALRGQRYEYNFEKMTQHNLSTGKTRQIRPPRKSTTEIVRPFPGGPRSQMRESERHTKQAEEAFLAKGTLVSYRTQTARISRIDYESESYEIHLGSGRYKNVPFENADLRAIHGVDAPTDAVLLPESAVSLVQSPGSHPGRDAPLPELKHRRDAIAPVSAPSCLPGVDIGQSQWMAMQALRSQTSAPSMCVQPTGPSAPPQQEVISGCQPSAPTPSLLGLPSLPGPIQKVAVSPAVPSLDQDILDLF